MIVVMLSAFIVPQLGHKAFPLDGVAKTVL